MFSGGKLRNMASVYLLDRENILLLYRQGHSIVHDLWIGSAGGHFKNHELCDATACVLRELKEELGLQPRDIQNLQLRYITLRNTDNEIRQNYYFFAELSESVPKELPSTEGITQWFSLNDLEKLPMPFTARYMIDHYLTVGRFNNAVYGGIASKDRVAFTQL